MGDGQQQALGYTWKTMTNKVERRYDKTVPHILVDNKIETMILELLSWLKILGDKSEDSIARQKYKKKSCNVRRCICDARCDCIGPVLNLLQAPANHKSALHVRANERAGWWCQAY